MRKLLVILVSTFAVSMLCENSHNWNGLDFSSTDYFWKISEILLKNQEPTDEEWGKLINTPGYLEYFNKEIPVGWFKEYVMIALMPSKQEQIKIWEQKGYSDLKYIKHFQEVIAYKKELILEEEKLKSDKSIMENSLALTKKYLPPDYDDNDFPPISFIFFDYDARGYSPVLVDLLFAYKNKENLKYFFAHEAHHYYRNKHLEFNYPSKENPDYDLVWTINQIHAEGIADQIDKKETFFDNGSMSKTEWAEEYRNFLQRSPSIITKMDSILTAYSKSENPVLSETFKAEVPMSGHTIGFFMVEAILDYRDIEELVSDLGNPFSFIITYNLIASESRGKYPEFSETSISLIRSLQEKYKK